MPALSLTAFLNESFAGAAIFMSQLAFLSKTQDTMKRAIQDTGFTLKKR
jgi:hypothetical protein